VSRSRKTTAKGLPTLGTGGSDTVDRSDPPDDLATRIDGPRLRDTQEDEAPGLEARRAAFEAELDAEAGLAAPPAASDDGADGDDEWAEVNDTEEVTLHRGSRPPKPSSSRRLSPTLMKVFQRRREEIGLSLSQLARITGVDRAELERFENTGGNHRLIYDHVVVIARALGIKAADLPGMRAKEDRPDATSHVEELHRTLSSGPVLTFEGASGERFGGPVERVGVVPGFAVRIGDASLHEVYAQGTLLAFVGDAAPRPGDVAVLRHRKSKQLLLRRLQPPRWNGLVSWQPAQPAGTGADWVPVARLLLVLYRLP
jgi:transcriptional regulator with XRE-family HTH domain